MVFHTGPSFFFYQKDIIDTILSYVGITIINHPLRNGSHPNYLWWWLGDGLLLLIIWLVVWNILYFSIYWELSSKLTNIFQRVWNHQPVIVILPTLSFINCWKLYPHYYLLIICWLLLLRIRMILLNGKSPSQQNHILQAHALAICCGEAVHSCRRQWDYFWWDYFGSNYRSYFGWFWIYRFYFGLFWI